MSQHYLAYCSDCGKHLGGRRTKRKAQKRADIHNRRKHLGMVIAYVKPDFGERKKV